MKKHIAGKGTLSLMKIGFWMEIAKKPLVCVAKRYGWYTRRRKEMKRSERKMVLVILTTMVLTALLLQCNPATAQFRGSVAEVFVEDHGRGKGFFVTRNLIVTCKHIIAKKYDRKTNTYSNFAGEVIVKHGLVKIRAEVVDVHTVYDLALLKVKGKGPRPFKLCGADRSENVTMLTFEFGIYKNKTGKIRDDLGTYLIVGITPVSGNSGSPLVQGQNQDMSIQEKVFLCLLL
jgi:hypothetical protein